MEIAKIIMLVLWFGVGLLFLISPLPITKQQFYYKEKIKRLLGIRSPSASFANFGNFYTRGFMIGQQKQKCAKVNSIYQPYEIKGAVILPSYGNVEYTVRAFEWTKRELLFD